MSQAVVEGIDLFLDVERLHWGWPWSRGTVVMWAGPRRGDSGEVPRWCVHGAIGTWAVSSYRLSRSSSAVTSASRAVSRTPHQHQAGWDGMYV